MTWWLLYRTRFGLRLRAVGENPAAVDTAGVSVVGLRYAAVAICGILCGIAGAYLSTALQAGFVKDMSAGRGFIALAALIFAKWRPWHALYATFLFGLFQALELRPDVIEAVIGMKVQGQFLGRFAIHYDRCHFGWLRRKSHSTTCWWRTICQRALMPAIGPV